MKAMDTRTLHCLWLIAFTVTSGAIYGAEPLERIVVSEDGKHFVGEQSGEPFVVWGVNYDHDQDGRLLDEYWDANWDHVVADFAARKSTCFTRGCSNSSKERLY